MVLRTTQQRAKRDELRLLQIPDALLYVRVPAKLVHEPLPRRLAHHHRRALEGSLRDHLVDVLVEQRPCMSSSEGGPPVSDTSPVRGGKQGHGESEGLSLGAGLTGPGYIAFAVKTDEVWAVPRADFNPTGELEAGRGYQSVNLLHNPEVSSQMWTLGELI
jgi:hypothetical protein